MAKERARVERFRNFLSFGGDAAAQAGTGMAVVAIVPGMDWVKGGKSSLKNVDDAADFTRVAKNLRPSKIEWTEFNKRFGSNFSDRKFAREGWKQYNAALQSTGDLVIGNLRHTSPYSRFEKLSSNRWSVNVNDARVQGGIDRGARFKLVTPRTAKYLDNAQYGESVFAREIKQLKAAGYIEVDGYMVPGR